MISSSFIAANLVVVLFAVLVWATGLIARAKRLLSHTQDALQVLASDTMSDLEKEKALQKLAVKLFATTFLFAFITLFCLGAPIGVVWLLEQAGLFSFANMIAILMRPDFIIGVSVFVIVAHLLFKKPTKNTPPNETPYSEAEKMLFYLAFAAKPLQMLAARLENSLYRSRLAGADAQTPVYITGMPRSGTTILLKLFHNSGLFASNTYRDVPFLYCPLIWQTLARPFYVRAKAQDRAHGDGMKVSVDSPEAFEEALWNSFWPTHYKTDRIELWQTVDKPDFIDFFNQHRKKIIAVRQKDAPTKTPQTKLRYVSKNNQNIARLSCLAQTATNATILVPFRHPVQQAASLLQQHNNFLKRHKSDPFGCFYMEKTGHYDFGENIKPVNFNNWLDNATHKDPCTIGFWVEYWLHCYQWINTNTPANVYLLAYDKLVANPQSTLKWAGQRCGLEQEDLQKLVEQGQNVHPPRKHDIDTSTIDANVLKQALELFNALTKQSPF